MGTRLFLFLLLPLICAAQLGYVQSAYAQSNYLAHGLLRAYNSVLNAEVNGIIKRERQNVLKNKDIYSSDKNQKIKPYTVKGQSSPTRVAKLSDMPVQNRNEQTGSCRRKSNKELNKVGWETF